MVAPEFKLGSRMRPCKSSRVYKFEDPPEQKERENSEGQTRAAFAHFMPVFQASLETYKRISTFIEEQTVLSPPLEKYTVDMSTSSAALLVVAACFSWGCGEYLYPFGMHSPKLSLSTSSLSFQKWCRDHCFYDAPAVSSSNPFYKIVS